MTNRKISLRLVVYSFLHRIQEFFGIKRGKVYFEYLYSKKEDVWDYKTSRYELDKYHRSLELIGSNYYASVLEVGCSIGVFTKMLSSVSDDITAIDISKIAVSKAIMECKNEVNTKFSVTNLADFKIDKKFDLICAAEVLYYLSDNDEVIKSVVLKISHMLRPGGVLLYVCGSWDVDRFNDWEEYFQKFSENKLSLVSRNHIADEFNNYRISILRKVA